MYDSVWRRMQHCWWWGVYNCQWWDLRGEQQREVRDRAGQEVQCDIQQAVQPQQGEEVWQCHRHNQWTILHQFFGEKMFNHQTSRVSCHEGTERMHLCTSCFHNSNISWYIHPICRTWQKSTLNTFRKQPWNILFFLFSICCCTKHLSILCLSSYYFCLHWPYCIKCAYIHASE